MINEELVQTSVWQDYEKGRNYHRRTNIYTDTDRNYRFFNGDQWEGAKLGEVEPIQKNFIKPIVKYKVAVVHDNLYAINFSSENFENNEFIKTADKYCRMLNRYARKFWEKDELDFKLRRVTKDAAINGEGVVYINWDSEEMLPIHEVIKKNDIYYGNENDDEIQTQPYILIRRRVPLEEAVEFARENGVSEEQIRYIATDNDNYEESGEAAKEELDDKVTLIYRFRRKNGTVQFSVSTRYTDIIKDADIGIWRYPIVHLNWEEKEGSARGEGEVRNLIPNQIEVNRIAIRRAMAVKLQAFPHTVVDTSKISNVNALNTTGSIIKTTGQSVDDVRKIIGTIAPAQMSSDVKLLLDDLISMSRELAGAGDVATGQVNPESASGRAILAVQNASQQPITEQKENCKKLIEDIARIDLEYIIAYSEKGIYLEEELTDEAGNEMVQTVKVPQSVLKSLKATVKIDVTPKSVFDKFAQEQTLEKLLTMGYFNVQKLPELEAYVNALDDDSVSPKRKLQEIIAKMKAEQQKIAEIKARGQQMQQRVSQFLMGGEDYQAAQIAGAMGQSEAEEAEMEEDIPEEEYVEE